MMVSWIIRLVFFLLLLYAFLWLLKRIFLRPRAGAGMKRRSLAVSELVQDPVCKVYLPRLEALRLERDGTTQYFCSRRCRRQYAEKQQ